MQKYRTNDTAPPRYPPAVYTMLNGLTEVAIPLLVLAWLLPQTGMSIESLAAVVVSSSFAVTSSALKVLFLAPLRHWYLARGRVVDFYLGNTITHTLVAIATLKLFEVVVH